MIEKRIFDPISEKDKKELINDMVNQVIQDFRKEKISDNLYKYEIELQHKIFVLILDDESMILVAELSIEMIEALKDLNNSGFGKKELQNLFEETGRKFKEIEIPYCSALTFMRIATEQMKIIVGLMDVVMGVGGAYAMFLSNPMIASAIFSVYEVIVDHFDDEEIYWQSAYFLFRAVFRMRSEEKK